jgi:hypothetical protein
VAKSVHAATTDKAEHAFQVTGAYPYSPNILPDEDFEPSEITREDKMCLMRIRKGRKLGVQMLTLPVVSMVQICLHLLLPEHVTTYLLPESTTHDSMEAKHPLREATGDKHRKRKPQEPEILSATPYKMFIESKEDEKGSKMKERAERQMKSLEGLREKRKTRRSKNKTRQELSPHML